MESIKDNYVKKKRKWKNPQISNRKEQIMGERIILKYITARNSQKWWIIWIFMRKQHFNPQTEYTKIIPCLGITY